MDSSFSVAIAIDFGTTFSGYAYGLVQRDTLSRNVDWKTSVGQKSSYVKTPTYLLYKGKDFDSWGYKAKQRLAELRQKGDARNYHFFDEYLKTNLFLRTHIDECGEPYLEDNGEKFLLTDLVAVYLREIRLVALQDVKSDIKGTSGSTINETQIRWCLTVPAFWDDTAKRLMVQAAKKAGIKKDDSIEGRFMFVSESEATTAYLLSTAKKLDTIENKATIMIVDCGGKTVNLTVHEIIREGRDKGLRKVESGSGATDGHGGKDVDKNFLNYLAKVLGSGALNKFEVQYPEAYVQMREDWEVFKYKFDPVAERSDFPIPRELHDLLQKQYPKVLKELANKKNGDNSNLWLTRKIMAEEIFGPVVNNILARVEDMFNRIGGKCDYLFLVGGFASAHFLQQRVRDKFASNVKECLIPKLPGECVMAGAASFALNPFMKLSLRMRLESSIIERSSPAVYELPVKEDMKDTKKMLRKCHIGQSSLPPISEKVLMVVGAAGAGKTTLINGMSNYILGVAWKDDFRFQLITEETKRSQAHSQTQFITAYTVYKMEGSPLPYNLTIIDTPGFGATEGLQRDKFITEQIREFFSMPSGIKHLDGIGFVTQSSLARLTPSQKYIFDAILSIFGKDIANNIFMMVTFCDGQKPPVIEAVKEANIPYTKFFKFNNSALFANNVTDSNENSEDEDDENFDEMFWKMGTKSFKTFFTEFAKAESRSLQLTKEVLHERKHLETTILGLEPRINDGLSKLDELRQVEIVIQQREKEIEHNKNFIFTVSVPKQRRVSAPNGKYNTTCLQCHVTCHSDCAYAHDHEKKGCSAMGSDGYCKVCGCHWSKHSNTPYVFEAYTEEETRTSGDLLQKYNFAVEGKNKAQSMLSHLREEFENTARDVFLMVIQVQQSLRRLEEIALKPDPLTSVEYLGVLIEAEKRDKKDGWQQRVDNYEHFKKQAQLLDIENNPDLQTLISKGTNLLQKESASLLSKLKFW